MHLKKLVSMVSAVTLAAGLSAQQKAPAAAVPPPAQPDIFAHLEKMTYKNAEGESLNYRFGAPEVKDGQKYPLLILLHGVGERGDDNQKQLVHGAKDIVNYHKTFKKDFFFIAPQCPVTSFWVETKWNLPEHRMAEKPTVPLKLVMELIEKTIKENPAVDPDRVYITGISMGGFGTWEILQRKGDLFAGALISCGGADVKCADRLTKIPIWAVHGEVDTVVLPSRAIDMQKAIQAAGGTKMIVTIYPKISHAVWNQVYSNIALLDWLFAQNRKNNK